MLVKFTNEGGRDSDQDYAQTKLELNKEYEVLRLDVSSWHTNVYLVGIDGKFNSCVFEDSDELCDAIRNWGVIK